MQAGIENGSTAWYNHPGDLSLLSVQTAKKLLTLWDQHTPVRSNLMQQSRVHSKWIRTLHARQEKVH